MFAARAFSAPAAPWCGLLALVVLAGPAGAAPREFSSDRPDATEGPFTIEPGRVQLEMDFASHTRFRAAGAEVVEREIAPFALRFGLTPSLEGAIQLAPWKRERETLPGGGHETRSGRGDVTLRAKLNLQGNDGGGTAWGVIVDFKLPTGSRALTNGKTEAAVLFPVAFDLPAGWSGGAMTEATVVYSERGGYRPAWTNSVTAGHAVAGPVGGFVELISTVGDGAAVALFNCGLTCALGSEAQLDGGVKIGLSRAAPDVIFLAGISRRF
ncbi:MAG: transporter [Opitutus sp.]|nr:transporter [Opitutus sp.]